ncbi:DCC1-like thiol-disulfide oxidoreductase family protein [Agrobacterium tumefaciens]|uniref:DCC1-like thiol-disulfide oxidoreductase family protein n=1 Tax=Agrobacterium tumefaciens TaxID=358 RepID=UPI003BA24CE7
MANMAPLVGDHHGPIILFDAECVLCSVNAQFVLRHDKAGYFRLASMQGAVGTEWTPKIRSACSLSMATGCDRTATAFLLSMRRLACPGGCLACCA